MKNIISLLIILSFLACSKNQPSAEIKPEQQGTGSIVAENSAKNQIQNVTDIKETYALINSKIFSKSLDSSFFKYSCNNEKSGKITYFTQKGTLRMIRHAYSEYSHFSATEDYYVQNDSVFFIFSKEVSWSFADQDKTKDEIVEKLMYIINGKPVKCLQNESTVLVSSSAADVSKAGSNKETDCSSFPPAFMQFKKLLALRNQKQDLQCLD